MAKTAKIYTSTVGSFDPGVVSRCKSMAEGVESLVVSFYVKDHGLVTEDSRINAAGRCLLIVRMGGIILKVQENDSVEEFGGLYTTFVHI